MQEWVTRVMLELPLNRGVAPTDSDQPFPKVDPACDFAALLVEFEASFAPAFDSAAFDGFALFPMVSPFRLDVVGRDTEVLGAVFRICLALA